MAHVRLAAPVVAVRGDRFVVRRPSPPTTLGGGTLLDPWWVARRGSRLRRAVKALSGNNAEAIRRVKLYLMEMGTDIEGKTDEALLEIAKQDQVRLKR